MLLPCCFVVIDFGLLRLDYLFGVLVVSRLFCLRAFGVGFGMLAISGCFGLCWFELPVMWVAVVLVYGSCGFLGFLIYGDFCVGLGIWFLGVATV